MTDRDFSGGGGASLPAPVDLVPDPAGNIRENGSRRYTHDAWNRLVAHDIVVGFAVSAYEYYGNHRRAVRAFDTSEPGDGTLDEERRLYYSLDWRLLEERIDEAHSGAFSADLVAQQFWGARHVDDAVLRRRGGVSDPWDAGLLSRHYYLSDVQFSSVALIDDAGVLAERVRYDPYGRGRHSWPHDVDGDGDADSTDGSMVSSLALTGAPGIGSAAYNVDADLNLDGGVNLSDVSAWNSIGAKAALVGRISDAAGPDNAIGYDGYHYDRESVLYYVRHRCYDPVLGRFIERDPIGYADGMSLYEYVRSSPFVLMDPLGLAYVAVSDRQNYYIPSQRSDAMSQFYHPGGTTLPREDRLEFNRRIAEQKAQQKIRRKVEQSLSNAGLTGAFVSSGSQFYDAGVLRQRYDAEVRSIPRDIPMSEQSKMRKALRQKYQRCQNALARTYQKHTGTSGRARNPQKTNQELTRKASRFRHAGRALTAAGVGLEVYDVVTAPPGETGRELTKSGGTVLGGVAAGAGLGAAGGAIGGPVGAVAGGVIDGAVGGILGEEAAEALFDWVW